MLNSRKLQISKAQSRNSRSSQSRGEKLSSKRMTRDTQSLHKVQRLHRADSNHLLKRGWYLHVFFFWDNFKHINVARLMQIIPVYPFSRVPMTSSLARGPHPGSFSCHISLASFTLELLISFSPTFMTLTFFFFGNSRQSFCRMIFRLGLSNVSSWSYPENKFLAEFHRTDAGFFSLHPLWRHVVSVCPNT